MSRVGKNPITIPEGVSVEVSDNKIIVKPYSPNLGGVVTGIDLSKEISNSELDFIKDAFNQYQVLFFQGKQYSVQTQYSE